MIDALFGSKTRVKLLHLFLNNPDKTFYVREITRLIDEQINSVRRELANMMEVGIVTSIKSSEKDKKLYYAVNTKYKYYEPLRMIFAKGKAIKRKAAPAATWMDVLGKVQGLRVCVAAGTLVRGSASQVDLVLVGKMSANTVKSVVQKIEKSEGHEINYVVFSYDDFYYRLSVRDKFIMDITGGIHTVLVDKEDVLK